MRKKLFFSAFATCILVAIASVLFSSCKEEEESLYEITYPENQSYEPFNIENEEGYFLKENEQDVWHFVPSNTFAFNEPDGGCGITGFKVIVTNMLDEFKNETGNVRVSGKAQFLYAEKARNLDKVTRQWTDVFSLTVSDVKKMEQNVRTRSSEGIKSKCATPNFIPPVWLFSRVMNTTTPQYTKANVRIFIHIVRSASGVGFSNSIATEIINVLNSYYEGSNISFSLSGTEYIDDDRYNSATEKDISSSSYSLFQKNIKTDAINLYILSDGSQMESYGVAQKIPSLSAIIKGSRYKTNTVPHEVGHCLGLAHTHKGTYPEEDGVPELVDGSNSAVAGDYITDTPADPRRWNMFGEYAGGDLTDANGDRYHPDPLNLMSHNGDYRKTFTQGQIDRIFDFIAHESFLRNACTLSSSTSISGPDYIEDKASYSFDVPSSCILNWDVQVKTFTSKTAYTTNNINAFGSPFTLNNPNSDATSQVFTITAKVTNRYGSQFKYSRTAYHVKPSAKTGTLTWGSSSNNAPGKTGTLNLEKGATYNRIQVYQGGYISFIYKDVCGVESYNDSYFSFNLYDRHFTRGQASHIFLCDRSTSVGSYNTQLALYVGNTLKVIPIIIEVLQAPNTPLKQQEEEEEEQTDETKTDK